MLSLKTLTLVELHDALDRCNGLTGIVDFIVVGSQAILGSFADAPSSLRTSQDIDLFPRSGATAEINRRILGAVGPESEFESEHGFYIEAVGDWTVATSLSRWRERLVRVDAPGGAIGWCLCPLDIAYNKAEAGREKDIAYLAELFRCGIVRPSQIKAAMDESGTTPEIRALIDARVQEAVRRVSKD